MVWHNGYLKRAEFSPSRFKFLVLQIGEIVLIKDNRVRHILTCDSSFLCICDLDIVCHTYRRDKFRNWNSIEWTSPFVEIIIAQSQTSALVRNIQCHGLKIHITPYYIPLRPSFIFICISVLSINKLSTISGVTQSTVSDIVNGITASARMDTIKKLCDGLEISVRQFFDSPLFDDLEQELK